MRTISLILFALITSSLALSQDIYLTTNLSGKYRITYDEISEDVPEIIAGTFHKITATPILEIEFEDNDATVKFKLIDIEFNENDTLNLDFLKYHDIDTAHYTSACLDGSNSINKTSYVEKNTGFQEVIDLPDTVFIMVGGRQIALKKGAATWVGITSGNGKKDGKPWGYFKRTFERVVTYTNLIE